MMRNEVDEEELFKAIESVVVNVEYFKEMQALQVIAENKASIFKLYIWLVI